MNEQIHAILDNINHLAEEPKENEVAVSRVMTVRTLLIGREDYRRMEQLIVHAQELLPLLDEENRRVLENLIEAMAFWANEQAELQEKRRKEREKRSDRGALSLGVGKKSLADLLETRSITGAAIGRSSKEQ